MATEKTLALHDIQPRLRPHDCAVHDCVANHANGGLGLRKLIRSRTRPSRASKTPLAAVKAHTRRRNRIAAASRRVNRSR